MAKNQKPRIELAWPVFAIGLLWSVSAAAEPVALVVKVIHAHNQAIRVDARIAGLVKDFGKLKYSAFDQKDEATFNLELGSLGRMQLPGGEWLTIQPLDVAADGKLRLEIAVDKLKLKSRVTVAPGATVAVGGPAFETGALILAITRPADSRAKP